MPKITLHHYPDSPFSEKIRLLLGYKDASYDAVAIPVIMPKPDLIALTGGYRRTPVMQLGADIYCDTAIIARVIDQMLPDGSIYPPGNEAAVSAASRWTDSVFFRVCVSLVFQPKVLSKNPRFADPNVVAAFVKDRAELTGGGSLTMPLETALPAFHNHLASLDRQFASSAFMFGNNPTEADFSTYHCCWFVHRNEILLEEFHNYAHVLRWLDLMRGFGHGHPQEIDSITAIESAAAVSPRVADGLSIEAMDGLRPGEKVDVMPTDYGFNPVRGVLMQSTLDHISLLREDPRAGTVAVHFPRVGFQIQRAASSNA